MSQSQERDIQYSYTNCPDIFTCTAQWLKNNAELTFLKKQLKLKIGSLK